MSGVIPPIFSVEAAVFPHIHEILSSYDKGVEKILPSPLYGSPERSRARCLFETPRGSRYILEEISPEQVQPRKEISQWLFLLKNSLPVAAYEQNRDGDFVTCHGNKYYQLQPYIRAHGCNQATYFHDAWRGESMAEYCIFLKKEGTKLPKASANRRFLPEYIENLCKTLAVHRPQLLRDITPVYRFVARQYDIFSQLPQVFCHGDFHPANILWGKRTIAGVIDWEFSGFDFILYDAALAFGCIASEGPDAAGGATADAFCRTLFSDPAYKKYADYFPLAVIALRFPWLSEWLRKEDEEMVEFEGEYLYFLADYFKISL